jgi:tRNA modification GTPase
VYNKIDLYEGSQVSRGTTLAGDDARVKVSALTGEGMDELRSWLLRTAGWQPGEGVFLARERHLIALAAAAKHLDEADARLQQYELLAEELRLAQQALSTITGDFSSDDLLGEIFGKFCIGK